MIDSRLTSQRCYIIHLIILSLKEYAIQKTKKKQGMILAGRKNQKLSFIGFTVMSALGSSF